jgi:hypothetical protein
MRDLSRRKVEPAEAVIVCFYQVGNDGKSRRGETEAAFEKVVFLILANIERSLMALKMGN